MNNTTFPDTLKKIAVKTSTKPTGVAVYVSQQKERQIHFKNLPFYEAGTIVKNLMGEADVKLTIELLKKIKCHQICCAGDFKDPHSTQKDCFDVVIEALRRLNQVLDLPLNSLKDLVKKQWINDSGRWVYKGSWQEWDITEIEMTKHMSSGQVVTKRYGIFIHHSHKDNILFKEAMNTNLGNLQRNVRIISQNYTHSLT